MNEEQMQQPGMSPDQSAAALAYATHLSEGMMPQMDPMMSQDAPQSPKTAPQSKEAPKEEMAMPPEHEAKMAEMDAKMDKMKVEMEAMIKGEISSIKDIIIEALNKDDEADKA